MTAKKRHRHFICHRCGYMWTGKRGFHPPQRCPSCNSSKWNEREIVSYVCYKCGHRWEGRGGKPERCPMCQMLNWDSPAYRLQCRRCGYKWVSRGGRNSSETSMCPRCKSKRWNETPVVRICSCCGKCFLLRGTSRSPLCPSCSKGSEVSECQCPFCGATWSSEDNEWTTCPVCGANRSSKDNGIITVWSDGVRSLKYVDENDCPCMYLWSDGVPLATMYFHDVLSFLHMTAGKTISLFGDPSKADTWVNLAGYMEHHKDDCLELVPYFIERLGLSEMDSHLLAYHFSGMGPEALAIKFGIGVGEVRSAFDRIMGAYVEKGIVVNDAEFTTDPVSKYDQDSSV